MNNRNSYPNRPNILFILSDDLGYWSLGCEGNSEAITPNIDSIAEQGVRLSQFFCTSPVCSPARASLFTGRMPSDHGVVDWLRKGSMNEEGDSPVQYLRGFKGFPEYLQEAGYRCGISGKWHLGDSQTPQMGFEHWYVHQQGGGPYFGAPMIRDGSPVTEDGYVTEAITNDALAFLRDQQQEERPFFLYVSYTAPHTPWINNHPQRYLD
ncbi:MAG: sulfatase-like hydrolase/transferase, partial [Clostridia bacterium]|nr:sulfatase-like hydrolase/transferase [Clostridia bacterium]